MCIFIECGGMWGGEGEGENGYSRPSLLSSSPSFPRLCYSKTRHIERRRGLAKGNERRESHTVALVSVGLTSITI